MQAQASSADGLVTRLLVTGTRDGRADVVWYLARWVDKHGEPSLFVCGDQTGVDTQAYEWYLHRFGRERLRREEVKLLLPSPRRYHERDERMAAHLGPGDYCLAFPIIGAKGTWLTTRLSFERGANIAVCQVRTMVAP